MSDPLATGILLKLDVTVWTGSAALSAPDLGLDPGTVAAHYTLGRKRLVPKAALDPIAAIVRQARYALDGLSHALPDGSRFVLEAAAPEVEAQLTHARGRFGAAVERFLAAYPRWRAEMAAEWDTAARAAWQTAGHPGEATPFVAAFLARVQAAYPAAEALRRKFDLFWWTTRSAWPAPSASSWPASPRPSGPAARPTRPTAPRSRPGSRTHSSGASPGSAPRSPRRVKPSSRTFSLATRCARAPSSAFGGPSGGFGPSMWLRTTGSHNSSPPSRPRAWTASTPRP